MPRLFGSLLRSATGGTGGGPTGGRASRTPFGGAGSGAGTGRGGVGSSGLYQGSTLHESDSTEGLRLDDEEAVLPRSRMENDIEFGELDKTGGVHSPGKRYSVSVVAGWEPASISQLGGGGRGLEKNGIQTTTVVTQKVTFASMMEEEARKSGQ
jgi:hypothetical protein